MDKLDPYYIRLYAGKARAAMKRSRWAAIGWNIALALVLAGCGGNSTGSRNDPPATRTSINMVIHDSAGNPLPGFEVFTTPATSTVTTDSTGLATIKNVEAGSYSVTARKEEYAAFTGVYAVMAAFPLTITLNYIPHISITVLDPKGRPAAGATLTTTPQLPDRILDQNGKTEFANLPVAYYSFIVKRDKFPDASFNNLTLQPEMNLVMESNPPLLTILSPLHNAKIATTRNIRLSGQSSDLEDGALPDSALVWSVDQSEELGRGRDLVVNFLSAGNHTITLSGTDSDGKRSETSIQISVYDYYLDTYFPIPEGETSDYRVLVPEFYVTDDTGLSEFWSIKQLTVIFNAGQVRDIIMRYDVARGVNVYNCVYTLTDHLQIENKSVYITSTDEAYTESLSKSPSLTMNITTQYVPRYLLFKNFMDLTSVKTWATKSDITIQWQYNYNGNSFGPFNEWKPISASFALGAEQSVQTDKGSFPAVELTVQTDQGAIRKWMLAKGLGIIRIEDETYDPKMTALLHDSSLFNLTMKAFGPGVAPPSAATFPPRYDLRIDRKNARDVRRLCQLLSTMCIR